MQDVDKYKITEIVFRLEEFSFNILIVYCQTIVDDQAQMSCKLDVGGCSTNNFISVYKSAAEKFCSHFATRCAIKDPQVDIINYNR